jgi:hypothetical protein
VRRNRLPSFSKEVCKREAPINPLQASVHRKGDRIVYTGSVRILASPPLEPHSFREYLYANNDLTWCLYSLELKNDGKDLADAITFGLPALVIAVGDGSFKDTFGTAAWTVGTEQDGQLMAGRAVCPGGPEHQSSYRSELTGLYVILAITHQLCLYYKIEAGQIEIGCDGLSALQTALESFPSLSTDIPDYDLLGPIFYLRRRSKITWSYRHVKGHQDDQSSDLDLWAQRNIKMDQWAKDHIQIAKHSSRHFNIPGEPWQLWAKDRKVTKHILPTLYETIFAYTSKE